jgi:hypothetical protein
MVSHLRRKLIWFLIFIQSILKMSFTSLERSIVIESRAASIPYPCPTKPENSHQERVPAGFRFSTEMNTIATGGVFSESVNEPYVPEWQPQARPENPSSRSTGEGVDRVETIWEPYKNRYRVLAACFTAFGNGMNDSANGALIESLEKYYDLCPP